MLEYMLDGFMKEAGIGLGVGKIFTPIKSTKVVPKAMKSTISAPTPKVDIAKGALPKLPQTSTLSVNPVGKISNPLGGPGTATMSKGILPVTKVQTAPQNVSPVWLK